ncbi:MAG TPA: PilZ domain-containing protein, partial [Sphingorhabdus sp.]|nr:PilZ domain-containing protein [Sphingorhabdus sp.]
MSGNDRREQLRHRTVMRAARLSSDVHRIEALGVVRNVSEGGMMISAHCDIEVGETINVSLLDGDRVEGKIVWKDGITIGIQFSSTIAIDHLLAKPRVLSDGTRVRPPRIALNREAMIRTDGCLADIEVCDISQRGAKIRFGKSLAV